MMKDYRYRLHQVQEFLVTMIIEKYGSHITKRKVTRL
jgi:hypothetical protein